MPQWAEEYWDEHSPSPGGCHQKYSVSSCAESCPALLNTTLRPESIGDREVSSCAKSCPALLNTTLPPESIGDREVKGAVQHMITPAGVQKWGVSAPPPAPLALPSLCSEAGTEQCEQQKTCDDSRILEVFPSLTNSVVGHDGFKGLSHSKQFSDALCLYITSVLWY